MGWRVVAKSGSEALLYVGFRYRLASGGSFAVSVWTIAARETLDCIIVAEVAAATVSMNLRRVEPGAV